MQTLAAPKAWSAALAKWQAWLLLQLPAWLGQGQLGFCSWDRSGPGQHAGESPPSLEPGRPLLSLRAGKMNLPPCQRPRAELFGLGEVGTAWRKTAILVSRARPSSQATAAPSRAPTHLAGSQALLAAGPAAAVEAEQASGAGGTAAPMLGHGASRRHRALRREAGRGTSWAWPPGRGWGKAAPVDSQPAPSSHPLRSQVE